MIEIKMLEASEGDCFLLKIKTDEKNYNILIDGGPKDTYYDCLEGELKKIFASDEFIDLLVITHICSDHLDGIKALFGKQDNIQSKIKKIWYNSAKVIADYLNDDANIKERENPLNISKGNMISKKTGYTLENNLKRLGYDLEIISEKTEVKYLDENHKIKFTFLSPDRNQLEKLNEKWPVEEKSTQISSSTNAEYKKSIKELLNNDSDYLDDKLMLNSKSRDQSEHNGASISFILEYNGKSLLFLGDSFDDVIVNSLNEKIEKLPLKIDVMKVSHHGSRKNISPALLKMIECENFLISTNGKRHKHPNKRTLARIIKYSSEPVTFYFNYNIIKKIFPDNLKEEEDRYKFKHHHLKKGLVIK